MYGDMVQLQPERVATDAPTCMISVWIVEHEDQSHEEHRFYWTTASVCGMIEHLSVHAIPEKSRPREAVVLDLLISDMEPVPVVTHCSWTVCSIPICNELGNHCNSHGIGRAISRRRAVKTQGLGAFDIDRLCFAML